MDYKRPQERDKKERTELDTAVPDISDIEKDIPTLTDLFHDIMYRQSVYSRTFLSLRYTTSVVRVYI